MPYPGRPGGPTLELGLLQPRHLQVQDLEQSVFIFLSFSLHTSHCDMTNCNNIVKAILYTTDLNQ